MFGAVRLATLALVLWPALPLVAGLGAGLPGDAAAWLGWLGRACGVVGLAWLLVAMVLSVRLPCYDQALGGLLKLWRFHHLLGAASFLLLMLHPVLLALAAVPGGPGAVLATLTPPADVWPVWPAGARCCC